ncbi:MAG: P-loop NTPase [candidate division KSB1 bacterium]|jgi:flagellar biosynthesis protein FlhG|nr:P-loop NTPase [candidate division KSB1 bacterium]
MLGSLLVRNQQKQYGPLDRNELKGLIQDGEFSSNDQVWLEDEGEWIQAEQVEELKSLFNPEINHHSEKKVIAIGSGKGGVGKTVTSASMGIALAVLGNDVILVDADFGGANLHTCMGILEPQYTFFDYYTLQRDSLEDILLDTPIKSLKMISGASGILGLANPKYSQKLRLIRELKKLDADYTILDLGAGASMNVIDFFIAVDEGIVVTTPEPTAIQESYDFIKLCLLRKLQQAFSKNEEVLNLLNVEGLNSLKQFNDPVEDLIEKASKISKNVSDEMEDIVSGFRPKLILNMVMGPDEIKEGASIKTAAAELLSVDIDYWGYVEYDEGVPESVKNLRPFIIDKPKSKASRSLAKLITVKMLDKSKLDSYIEKRKLRKFAQTSAEQFPSADSYESKTICSVNCFYWDDCEYQNGGYPCKIRHLESLFKSK